MMLFDYIAYVYYTIKNYFWDNIDHVLPFDPLLIEKEPEFHNFKIKTIDINKVMFALNNLPNVIHELLFKHRQDVCHHYYYITLNRNQNNEIIDIFHNIGDIKDQILNDEIKYIYIRINIVNINKKNNQMDHINCIICDKIHKTILIFEPKTKFTYDVNIIMDILNQSMDIKEYKILLPEKDIGYNSHHSLQKYDAYCQTYVLLVFVLIIHNSQMPFEKYSSLFNCAITYKNIGYFLFTIHQLLKENKIDICYHRTIWSYPTDHFSSIWTLVNYFYKSNEELDLEPEIVMRTENGIEIVDLII